MENKLSLFITDSFIAVSMMATTAVLAEQSLSETVDCSEITINYVDRPDMTRAERLEAMNRAFYESVNRFELCSLSNQSNSSANAASSSATNGASVSGTENSQTASSDSSNEAGESGADGVNSKPSASLSGTEIAESSTDTQPLDAAENNEFSSEVDEEGVPTPPSVTGSGNVPEDIPPANNDDAVAAQIRLAAEIEKDPVKKEKLWNEYRKYKGLPVKEVPAN